jgi:hypothetical protein
MKLYPLLSLEDRPESFANLPVELHESIVWVILWFFGAFPE